MKYEPNSLGAVITFKEGITYDQINEAMRAMENLVSGLTIKQFDSRFGGPVWYIP